MKNKTLVAILLIGVLVSFFTADTVLADNWHKQPNFNFKNNKSKLIKNNNSKQNNSKKTKSPNCIINFTDLNEAEWAANCIDKLFLKGIILGYSDHKFKPNKPVNHSEAVVLTMQAAGYKDEINKMKVDWEDLSFQDSEVIPLWSRKAIALAVKNGFIENHGTFQPQKAATREWVLKLIVDCFGLKNRAVLAEDTELPFKDADQIDPDLAGYVTFALENGIISGMPNGMFQPHKPVTRAQLVVMLEKASCVQPDEEHEQLAIRGMVIATHIHKQGDIEGTITLEIEHTGTVAYNVPVDTPIYIENKLADLHDIKVGSIAELIKDNNNKVIEININENTVTGLILSVSSAKIQIYTNAAVVKEYKIESGADVTIGKTHSSLAKLKPGMTADLTLNDQDIVTIIQANTVTL